MAGEQYRLIFLSVSPEPQPFTHPSGGSSRTRQPERERASHAEHLLARLRAAWTQAEDRQAVAHVTREGVYLDFVGDPGHNLQTKSLDQIRSGIRLLNVRVDETAQGPVTRAAVYVPNARRGNFLRKIQAYAAEDDTRGEVPKPKNMALVASIADIRGCVLESFWQDSLALIPGDQPDWIEVWLSSDQPEVSQRFQALAASLNLPLGEGLLTFPERSVLLVRANRRQTEALIQASDDIAELRQAKEVASFWVELENREQAERARELLGRTRFRDPSHVAVCILDHGVNNGHVLLQPVLADADRHTVDRAWGVHDDDRKGHGTAMAGLAAYGDLGAALSSGGRVDVGHRLESAKILPPPPVQSDPKLWGYLMAQGVSLAEITEPTRRRVVCMAVTATDSRDRGRPSSWSAMVDEVTSGAQDGKRRLMIVSAGNVAESADWLLYPESNKTNEVHDPAQAWNALTVGACTDLVALVDPTLRAYQPVAPAGGLSPFSTTSLDWEPKWPVKPEVLFEGGNVARGPNDSILNADDLALVSTCHAPASAQFVPFSMTSAATALASWAAARIQTEYPDAWPETIRALLVHSAQWTDTMKHQFLTADESKQAYRRLLRICGYGEASLERALYCARNTLTLIAQAELQPYAKGPSGNLKANEMCLHRLPWPQRELLSLAETPVEMRVTLSYFVEPGPGEVGWRDRYRYPSFLLRFELNSPGESEDEFVLRINAAAREDEEHPATDGPTDHWVIGAQARNVGSIHSDIWRGTAADLAQSNLIAVWPATGWWKERHHLGKWGKTCRYALVVSIHTPEETIDIYTPVAVAVGIAATVPVQVRL